MWRVPVNRPRVRRPSAEALKGWQTRGEQKVGFAGHVPNRQGVPTGLCLPRPRTFLVISSQILLGICTEKRTLRKGQGPLEERVVEMARRTEGRGWAAGRAVTKRSGEDVFSSKQKQTSLPGTNQVKARVALNSQQPRALDTGVDSLSVTRGRPLSCPSWHHICTQSEGQSQGCTTESVPFPRESKCFLRSPAQQQSTRAPAPSTVYVAIPKWRLSTKVKISAQQSPESRKAGSSGGNEHVPLPHPISLSLGGLSPCMPTFPLNIELTAKSTSLDMGLEELLLRASRHAKS